MTADDGGLSSWLQKLGFAHNPFGYARAERSPSNMLQKTYVYNKTLDALMRDPQQSVVFLAPFGGGKTAARRYTSFRWEDEQPQTLVVIYTEFSMVARALPNCQLDDHIEPLMRAIVTAVGERITKEPSRFTQLIQSEQEWWLRLFRQYAVSGIDNLVKDSLDLLDYILNSRAYETVLATEQKEAFALNASLSDRLTQISVELAQLRFTQLLILVDEVDDYTKDDELKDMEGMLKPLMSVMSIYKSALWKFFVPDILTSFIRKSAARRKRAIATQSISWDTKETEHLLKKFLEQRLLWASNDEIKSLNELTADEALAHIDLDEELITLARKYQKEYGIPRTLLDLGDRLIRFAYEQEDPLLTKPLWDNYLSVIATSYQ